MQVDNESLIIFIVLLRMWAVKFDGYFEIEDPTTFINEINVLLNKSNGTFQGTVERQNLGDYVDFQPSDV